MDLTINPKFQNLIPPLTDDERSILERSIINEGCRDALITWNDTVVDGHNRYEICRKHNIDFKTLPYEFKSDQEAKIWIIDNQKGRRNITDGWKWELAQEKKRLLEEKGREKYKKDVGRPSKEKSLSIIDNNKFTDNIPKQEPKHNTQKELAKELNWSTGKVAMADKVWKETDDYTKEKIKKGEETISGAYRKLTEQNRKAERKKTIANEPKEIDNFERLKKHALALAEGLQFWADGTMKPETENEAVAARIIRHAAPMIITQYSRLGINIPAIYDTFIDPNRRERNESKQIVSGEGREIIP